MLRAHDSAVFPQCPVVPTSVGALDGAANVLKIPRAAVGE